MIIEGRQSADSTHTAIYHRHLEGESEEVDKVASAALSYLRENR